MDIEKTTTKCEAAVKRHEAVIAPCNLLKYFPLVINRYDGATITDIDGNEYIDFLSSAGSMDLGGGNEKLLETAETQMRRCMQYSMVYVYNNPAIELAERLASVFPGKGPAKVCYGNCGADANDAAMKFARAYTGRPGIITFINGYHGCSYGALSMSTVTSRMKKGLGPLLPEIYHFPFSNCAHCAFGKDRDSCDAECLGQLEDALETYLPPEEMAAVIIEPIQGDGGLIPAHPLFMKKLYELCRANGILFISEEVQQGFGRCGKWFAIENYDGIEPDGVVMGKSIGGGFSLGAFMARSEIIDMLPAPAHLFTMGGNPMACAGGAASFDIIAADGFLDEVTRKGEYIKRGFEELKKKYDIIGDIRGMGLSIGVEIVEENSNEPDPKATSKICWRCYERGLVMIQFAGFVLRVQPPLIISYDQIDKAMKIIDRSIDDFVNGRIPDSALEKCRGW